MAEQTISTISKTVSLGKGPTTKLDQFNNWLGAGLWGLGIAELCCLNKDLQQSWDGPSYAAGARAMYDRAGAAGKKGGNEAFIQVIREDLPRLTLVRTPEPARARGVPIAVHNVDGFRDAVTTIKAELSARGTDLDAAAVSEATKALADLRTSLIKSYRDTTVVSIGERPVKIGAIGALAKLHREYLTQFADSKSAEMVEVTVGAVSAGLDALSIQLQFSGKAGLSTIDSTILNLSALDAAEGKSRYDSNIRELVAQVPQYMMFAIGSEESAAWALAEQTVQDTRKRVLSSAAAANASVLPDAACQAQVTKIPPGGDACGVTLTKDHRILWDGATVQLEPDLSASVSEQGEFLRVYPASPSGRYRVVDYCWEECGKTMLLDRVDRRTYPLDVVIYGPEDWSAWSQDSQYVMLLATDDGVSWLNAIRSRDGKRLEAPLGLYNKDSFSWLGPNRFRISLAACPGDYCDNTRYPDDLVGMEFEIADDGFRLLAIDDPSKAPVELRNALAQKQLINGTSVGSAKSPDKAGDDGKARYQLTLRNGESLVGRIEAEKLGFTSSFGPMQITVAEIADFHERKLKLTDGTVLLGDFGSGALPVTTAHGKLEVKAGDLVGIARADGQPAAAPAAVQPVNGQGVLIGRVRDNFQQPVAGATVRILGSGLSATTDQDGRYQLGYVPGQIQVRIEGPGYDPIEFPLALTAASQFPVEEKEVLRLPPTPGVHYMGKNGWSALQPCILKKTREISGHLERGAEKETFRVTGTALQFPTAQQTMFLHLAGEESHLLVYRVDGQDEILTETSPDGFGGLFQMINGSKGETSIVHFWTKQIFPGRDFYFGKLASGVYAIVDRYYQNTCYKFQIGDAERRAEPPAQVQPKNAGSLSVDGKTVSYWPSPSPSDAKQAQFRFETKGYRNTYRLDCAGARFRWTENYDLATGHATANTDGAEWKPLNPKSAIANAVSDAICSTILAGPKASNMRSAKEAGTPPVTESSPNHGAATGLTPTLIDSLSLPAESNDPLTITFQNGQFTHGKVGDDDFTHVEITNKAFGDLNQDGVDDSAIIITETGGGSQVLVSLVAILANSGTPLVVGKTVLGDRTAIKSLKIASNRIVLDVIVHGPEDAMCCPTVKKRLEYSVVAGKMVESKRDGR